MVSLVGSGPSDLRFDSSFLWHILRKPAALIYYAPGVPDDKLNGLNMTHVLLGLWMSWVWSQDKLFTQPRKEGFEPVISVFRRELVHRDGRGGGGEDHAARERAREASAPERRNQQTLLPLGNSWANLSLRSKYSHWGSLHAQAAQCTHKKTSLTSPNLKLAWVSIKVYKILTYKLSA